MGDNILALPNVSENYLDDTMHVHVTKQVGYVLFNYY